MLSKIDLDDFMKNDDNPQLRRLSDKLMMDPEFQRVVDTWGEDAKLVLEECKKAIDYCSYESFKQGK